mmetsp:Transcript_8766/g.26276  ORF Transcript_8766/g.26276 Transcript_8766/m.26276 type:complete len:332 (+) Transcript_8766:1455-2450(+)
MRWKSCWDPSGSSVANVCTSVSGRDPTTFRRAPVRPSSRLTAAVKVADGSPCPPELGKLRSRLRTAEASSCSCWLAGSLILRHRSTASPSRRENPDPSLSHKNAQWWSGREDPSCGPTSASVRPMAVTQSDWSPTESMPAQLVRMSRPRCASRRVSTPSNNTFSAAVDTPAKASSSSPTSTCSPSGGSSSLATFAARAATTPVQYSDVVTTAQHAPTSLSPSRTCQSMLPSCGVPLVAPIAVLGSRAVSLAAYDCTTFWNVFISCRRAGPRVMYLLHRSRLVLMTANSADALRSTPAPPPPPPSSSPPGAQVSSAMRLSRVASSSRSCAST